MKKLLLALALIWGVPCLAAPVLVQKATPVRSAVAASQAITLTGVGAHHLLVIITSINANEVPSSITDSLDAVTAGPSASSSTAAKGFEVAYIPDTTAGSHTVTVSVTTNAQIHITLAEYSGVVTTSPVDGTPSGSWLTTSNPYVTGSVTPTVSGDLAIAYFVGGSTGTTFSSWTASFVQEQLINTNDFSEVWADEVYGSTAALTVSATPSAAATHGQVLIFFKAAAGSSCTHAGYTSAGASTVPTSGSTSVWLKTGAFGTVDCSTTNYWQPAVGNFGTN